MERNDIRERCTRISVVRASMHAPRLAPATDLQGPDLLLQRICKECECERGGPTPQPETRRSDSKNNDLQ